MRDRGSAVRRVVAAAVVVGASVGLAACGAKTNTFDNGVVATVSGKTHSRYGVMRVEVENKSALPRDVTLGYQYCAKWRDTGDPEKCVSTPLVPTAPQPTDGPKAGHCHSAPNALVDNDQIQAGARVTKASLAGGQCAVYEFLIKRVTENTEDGYKISLNVDGAQSMLSWDG
jgi:hypothetical protein